MKKTLLLLAVVTLLCGCTTKHSSSSDVEESKNSDEYQTESYSDEQNTEDDDDEKPIYVDGFDEPMTEEEFDEIVDQTENQIEELPEETQIFIDSLISGEVYELYDIDKTFTDYEIERMISLALNGDSVEFILEEYK